MSVLLTEHDLQDPAGQWLLNEIFDICQDCDVSLAEIQSLYEFLNTTKVSIPAVGFIQGLARDIVEDGQIEDHELLRLKSAFLRVTPAEYRGIVETHLAEIGVPPPSLSQIASWRSDAPTPRQIDYIVSLGGDPSACETKGDASELIDALLHRRPPTRRQLMVLRFFDRLNLQSKTKDEVSSWIDDWFWADADRELAWHRFKQDPTPDFDGFDPATVPLGAYRRYTRR